MVFSPPGPLAARNRRRLISEAERRVQERALAVFEREQEVIARRRHLGAIRAMQQVAAGKVRKSGPTRDARGRFAKS